MATVIKQATDAGAVRRLVEPMPLPALRGDPRDETIALLMAERDTLAADLAAARMALAATETRAREAVASAVAETREEAFAEGRSAGIAAAETREADRISAIVRGVEVAATRFDACFASIDGLAAALARACLERVFARPEAMAAMVTDALARHLAVIRDEAILAVRVSGADFADTTALDTAARAAGARATVAIDLDLPAGACRISGRLGQVDLDVPGQWTVLAALLDDMARA